jgi:hypothetical protein
MVMPITTNLSGGRKHTMKSFLAAISLALAFVSSAFAGIDWGFDTGANPLEVSGAGGSGTATIAVGAFGTGWQSGGSVPWNLGTAQGFWDLGRAGSIVLSSLSGSGLTTLNVFQWVDPGIYSGDLTVAASSGSVNFLGSSLIGSLNNGGGWYDFAYSLSAALSPADTVTITAGQGGAIIDRLTVVPEPATVIAGVLLLIPLALSTWPMLRRKQKSEAQLPPKAEERAEDFRA